MVRGIGDGMELWQWLSTLDMPFADKATSEEALAGVRVSAIEAVRNGTTCVFDHHYAPVDLDTTLGVASEMEAGGLRGIVARGMYGPANHITNSADFKVDRVFQYSVDDEINITQEAMEARPPDSKVAIWPAPAHLTINEQDLIFGAVELSREFKTGWHTHLAEVRSDLEVYVEHYGIRPVT